MQDKYGGNNRYDRHHVDVNAGLYRAQYFDCEIPCHKAKRRRTQSQIQDIEQVRYIFKTRQEENLLFLISTLIQNYGQPFESCVPECGQEIEKACEFIRQHYNERIYLDQICRYAGLSKSSLLRAFTKTKGITPYRYLETIRINEAKALLEKGVQPIDAAMQTGFSDQSHFTNYFSSFIGLAPGVYREIFSDKGKDGV